MRLGFRREAILSHGCHRHAEGVCYLLMGHSLTQTVNGISKSHVCSMLDKVYAVGYTLPRRAETNKVGVLALPRRRFRYTHLTRTGPEVVHLRKLALPGRPGQENLEVFNGRSTAAGTQVRTA